MDLWLRTISSCAFTLTHVLTHHVPVHLKKSDIFFCRWGGIYFVIDWIIDLDSFAWLHMFYAVSFLSLSSEWNGTRADITACSGGSFVRWQLGSRCTLLAVVWYTLLFFMSSHSGPASAPAWHLHCPQSQWMHRHVFLIFAIDLVV